MPVEYFNDRNRINKSDLNIKVYSNIRIITINVNIMGPGSEFIPHDKNATLQVGNPKEPSRYSTHPCSQKDRLLKLPKME